MTDIKFAAAVFYCLSLVLGCSNKAASTAVTFPSFSCFNKVTNESCGTFTGNPTSDPSVIAQVQSGQNLSWLKIAACHGVTSNLYTQTAGPQENWSSISNKLYAYDLAKHPSSASIFAMRTCIMSDQPYAAILNNPDLVLMITQIHNAKLKAIDAAIKALGPSPSYTAINNIILMNSNLIIK